MKAGDHLELGIWLSGTETPENLEHWKTKVCVEQFKDAVKVHNLDILPPWFTVKNVGDDRVPPVPNHISGPDVRLLVAETRVIPGRPIILRESGFVTDLRPQDLARLRKITRRAHAKRHPGDRLSDRHCDQVIEALGPETALKTLRDNEDGRNIQ